MALAQAEAQGQDGQPHVTYYDKSHVLSFVWDGTRGPWIDVAHGGYAEAVFARIPFAVENVQHDLMEDFRTSCLEFIETIDQSVSGSREEAS